MKTTSHGPAILSMSAMALLMLYQGWNLSQHAFLVPWRGWSPVKLGIKSTTRSWVGFDWWEHPQPLKAYSLDAGSRLLSEMGFQVAYALDRLPDFVIAGEKRPFQRLYTRDEVFYQYLSAVEEVRKGFGSEVRAFVQGLESHGVTVVIVPVPTKISIERGKLPASLPQDAVWSSKLRAEDRREGAYAVYRVFVEELPKNVVDLQSVFSALQAAQPTADIYVPGDTHWSCWGMAQAAEAVVRHLRKRGWKVADPAIRLRDTVGPFYYFDLVHALQLPLSFLKSAPEFQWREPLYEMAEAPTDNGRFILAGSCYSRRKKEGCSFGGLLEQALGRLFVDISVDNGRATEPLAKLVQEKWVLSPGDLLIWEFPVRQPPKPGEAIPLPYLEMNSQEKN